MSSTRCFPLICIMSFLFLCVVFTFIKIKAVNLKFEKNAQEAKCLTVSGCIRVIQESSLNKKVIGSLEYIIFPFKMSVIHNLYIEPLFRRQGIGHELLTYTCDFLRDKGMKKVFIQPGPFEVAEGEKQALQNASFYKERLQKLVSFYEREGFCRVGKIMQTLAFLLYKTMGIEEDSHFLMMKELK